jgi:ADP-ribosylglycohydrolase
MSNLYKIKSVIFGHAVADALGVPVEFYSREELDRFPVRDMEGYGTYPYPKGCWSDDTSMTLAALDSLKDGKIDYHKIMENFIDWLMYDKYTPTGEMFDA